MDRVEQMVASMTAKRLTDSAQKGQFAAYSGSLCVCIRPTKKQALQDGAEWLRKHGTPERQAATARAERIALLDRLEAMGENR